MRRAMALALVGVLAAAACGPPRRRRIVVGCKNFTEQVVLGELLAQEIEAKTGLAVERRFYLAGSFICHQAILAGRIDVYPEYTGTAMAAILKQKPEGGAARVYRRVKQDYARRFGLAVGPPFGFNNSFAMVIRGDDAARLRLSNISQAVPYAARWRPGFGYEFMERPDGYAGFVKAYGIKFGAAPRIMELGLLYRALQSHEVDLVAGNSTDGLIDALHLTVLADDRGYFPPYQAVPIVSAQAVAAHPELMSVLNLLAGRISDDEMRRMNYAVDGTHLDPAGVVRKFRQSKGL